MVALSHDRYTRASVVQAIDAFLDRQVTLDTFRDWVEDYDWDLHAGGDDRTLRRALARLELALHERDSHEASDAEMNEMIRSARDLLVGATQ